MSNLSKNTFLESKGYVRIIFQQGMEVADFELAELQDMLWSQVLNVFHTMIGSFPIGDGFKVVSNVASPTNNVLIRGGRFIASEGILVDFESPDGFLPITGLNTPVSGNRVDLVYMRITKVEIDSTDDPAIYDSLVGHETNIRLKLSVTFGVAEGAYPTPPGSGEQLIFLAVINRLDSDATITNAMITDVRDQYNSNYVVEGLKVSPYGDTHVRVSGGWAGISGIETFHEGLPAVYLATPPSPNDGQVVGTNAITYIYAKRIAKNPAWDPQSHPDFDENDPFVPVVQTTPSTGMTVGPYITTSTWSWQLQIVASTTLPNEPHVLLAVVSCGTTVADDGIVDMRSFRPYMIGHRYANPAHPASAISFDNAVALLSGSPTNVQTALVALDALADSTLAELSAHVTGYSPKHAATHITFSNSYSHLAAVNVQEALDEEATLLSDHFAGTDDKHHAEHVIFSNTTAQLPGSPADVQAAIDAIAEGAVTALETHRTAAVIDHPNGSVTIGKIDPLVTGNYLAGTDNTLKLMSDEITAARGSKTSVDARLDVSLNEDGSLKAGVANSIVGLDVCTTGAAQLTISPGFMSGSGGQGTLATPLVIPFDVTTIENGASPVNLTWYYLYLKVTNGLLVPKFSTTAPTALGNHITFGMYRAALFFKTVGGIVPFRKIGRQVQYLTAQTAANYVVIGPASQVATTSPTAIVTDTTQGAIPPTAVEADLVAYCPLASGRTNGSAGSLGEGDPMDLTEWIKMDAAPPYAIHRVCALVCPSGYSYNGPCLAQADNS